MELHDCSPVQTKMGQVSFSYIWKGRQLSWDTQTAAQASHQIQALQHRLTSALLLPYWCGFSEWQSSQKTRIKEFNVEGNRHCVGPVLMEFSTGDYFIFRNWRCAEALKHKKTQAHQVDFYLRRQEVEGGVCEPAWVARSACPWGQNWEIAVTPCTSVLHNLQSYSVSLLIELDENGFAHLTTAKSAAILQLVWAFLQKMPP